MKLKGLCRVSIAIALVLAFQATRTLAGTTGALTGYVGNAQSNAAIAGAQVTAAAASQTGKTTTDSTGHFAFVSLIPDTYTVTATKDGYITTTVAGVTVTADNTRTITVGLTPSVKTLGTITTRGSAAALVKPGTTSDVYSVNSSTQEKVANLGGGGDLTQAYSAMAATPGVVVLPGQNGWFQTVHIRGGDYDQIGYEFDGVPVLRSYDNYPTTDASTLGQQELQVYTGAAPANSESQGLAGYINQVIKSGTYPGFANFNAGIGAPAFSNLGSIEVGGGTPDRTFTYYLASSGSAYDPRYIDNNQGASYQALWGTPFAKLPCPSAGNANFVSCYASGIGQAGFLLNSPVNSVNTAQTWDYENVVNLHFGIPHHADSGRDDIQLLYDNSYLHNLYFSSADDNGFSDPHYAKVYGAPSWVYPSGIGFLGYQYLGPVNAPLASNYQAMTQPYYYPYNPQNVHGGLINVDQRDGTANPNSIIKLQYQHNFGSNAYFRIYGYNNYSTWNQTCPVTFATNFVGYCPNNYYVQTYTNGVSATYANQLNDKNLLTVIGSDMWAKDYRAYDFTMANEFFTLFGPGNPGLNINVNTGLDTIAYAVNANNPSAGIGYSSGAAGCAPFGTAISPYSGCAIGFGLKAAATGASLPALPASCSGGPCELYVAENGRIYGANQAQPNEGTFAITDEIRPSQKWYVNIGAREDRYFYQLSNTGLGARTFWFNAFNNSYCVLPGPGHVPFYNGSAVNPTGGVDVAAGAACPTLNGVQTIRAIMTNKPNDTTQYWVVQPRFGTTYTAGEDDVFRLSYGRYSQPVNTAFQQYNIFNQDLASYDAINFWPLGFTTTTHFVPPQTEYNADFSWEHRFPGSQASFKLTPFLRLTTNQNQNFFLNQKTNFVSGLDVGNQSNTGVEFLFQDGNFNANGLSGLLSYTYTHAYIVYTTLGSGGTALSTINVAIQNYNSYTKACAGATPTSDPTSMCGTNGGTNALPTFGAVGNPYYNAPPQPLLANTGKYAPYSTIPGGIESENNSYIYPHVAALVLNYKHDKWAFSPQVQFFQGPSYGEPLSGHGVNPATCTSTLATPIAGDPRYPYGGTGAPFDATSCGGSFAVPDPYTGTFDSMGEFRGPSQLLVHAQINYDLSQRTTATINLANIVNYCFGGASEPWTKFNTNKTCGFVLPGYAAPVAYGANFYNPGSARQPEFEFPYQMNVTGYTPFQATFSLGVKL